MVDEGGKGCSISILNGWDVGSRMSPRSREDQEGFMIFKNAFSGLVVSPKSSVNVVFKMSSRMWSRQAIQRSCHPRKSSRSVQQPLWTPVLELVVSNPQAMIFSAIYQVSLRMGQVQSVCHTNDTTFHGKQSSFLPWSQNRK